MIRAVLNAMPVVFGAGCAGPMAAPSTLPPEVTQEWYDRPVVDAGRSESASRASYLRAGDPDRPRVIMVHGTPGRAANFMPYLTDPDESFEWIAVDRPGFGGSSLGEAVVSLERQAAAIAPLLRTNAAHAPILIGHSLGGPVVARAAVDYAGDVGAIVIVAGSLDPDLERVLAIQRFGDFGPVPWFLPEWARHSNRELIALEDELRELAPLLGEIRCPVVVVHGTEDALVPYENVGYMRRAFAGLRDVEFTTLEGANHFLPWNAERDVRAAIVRAAELAGIPRVEPIGPD